ncbi:FtsK/SpoIIIE domain-containing protein [Kineococcus sp. SYSU DK004]|uniref:FtsK/SpoIIIE domain-containing protein n=1 Tax=Kineococcus sp. SYSU DK004 TaxID=3383125 RepID=UPI003D7E4102
MQLEVTVVTADGEVDLEVTAPPRTTFGEAADTLEAACGPWAARPRADGAVLDDGALLGSPPLLRGAVLDTRPPAPAARARPAVARVHVAGGPDAGHVLDLPPGRWLLGRSPSAAGRVEEPVDGAVALADPGLSRAHAVLEVAADGAVAVHDTGSRAGTRPLGGDGARTALGATVLRSDPEAVVPAHVRPDGDGHLLLSRSPRLAATAAAPLRLAWPREEPAPVPAPFPWLPVAVPFAVSVLLALLWTPLSLLLGLAGPVLVGGQWWAERRRSAAAAAHRRADVLARRADVLDRARGALRDEHGDRHRAAPDPAALLAQVTGHGTRVWERAAGDGDVLHLRLGLGDAAPASVALVQAGASPVGVAGVADVAGPAQDPPEELAVLADVPVLVDLPGAGVLGVAGARPAVLASARWLLAQVAAWHAPGDVRVALAHPESPEAAREWAWVRRLPHARGVGAAGEVLDEVAETVRTRTGARAGTSPDGARPGPLLVLLLDGTTDAAGDGTPRLREDPRVAAVLRDGPRAGVLVVHLAADRAGLPAECTAVLLHGTDPGAGPGGARAALHDASGARPVRADGVGAAWALRVARALAPLREAGAVSGAGAVPDACTLLELLPGGPAGGGWDAGALAARWERGGPATRAVLGAGAGGPVVVDLAVDGPHTLVAGTTGSGKSVLLRALVASLAAQAPPEAVQLVLVDYKGGAAFGALTGLPHVAGLVTDLDDQLADRVLRSLGAEVRRRERLLRTAGAASLDDLPAGAAAAAGLPRLVVVVDEFRVLTQEVPELVDGLVRLAAVGRSLGVHLVLATQRPAGAVSPEVRANTDLRICLRVQDRADAQDVVDDPSPAAISDRRPGRGVLRRGGGALEEFQSALVGDRPPVVGLAVRRADAAPLLPTAPREDDGLARLVAAAAAAAARRGVPVPAAPWLPPLPARVTGADLPAPAGVGPGALPWGLLDLPTDQARGCAAWDLDRGEHLLVVGTVRSGRSTLLRVLALAGLARGADVLVLDGGGALAGLAGLQGAGAVVARHEPWRAARVLQRLLERLDAPPGGSREAQRDAPPVLLLVDGWETWSPVLAGTEVGDGAGAGTGAEALLRLLREGSAAGVRVAVAGDRPLLTSPLAASVAEVVLLRLADRADAALAGVPASLVPRAAAPGRGLLVRDGTAHEVQVALPEDGTSTADRPPARLRVAPLPPRSRAVSAAPGVPGSALLLGHGGDDGGPVLLDPAAGPVLVHGPSGSGRSSLLRALAQQRPGALAVSAGHDAAALAARLRDGRHPLLLLLDGPPPPGSALEDVLLAALDAGAHLVASAGGGEVAGAFRGLGARLRAARSLVLLGRGPLVPAEVLGRRPLPAPGPGPGAGFAVVDGVWTAVRVVAPTVTG